MNPELNISGTQKRMNKPENRFVWRSSPSLKGEVSGANRGMYTPPPVNRGLSSSGDYPTFQKPFSCTNILLI